ncbi:GNAT family N-acetyltransferase [Paenibacillus medicaginis]|uniref:GNAT family N-acetyltransferase n=1 Tax=Paenibacillus medicaginis TaxID=1470560 RepID=A0ABV5C4U9_9BACL
MIRKLTEADRESVMMLVGREPSLNLFIIADVENFGFESDFQELWGEFDAVDGRLKAVLLRYDGSYLPYAEGEFDVQGFAELVLSGKKKEMLSGSSPIVDRLAQKISFTKEKRLFFAELITLQEKGETEAGMNFQINQAGVEDVEAVCSLLDQIQEFSSSAESMRSGMQRRLETRTGRSYFVEKDGKVIAVVSSTAENSLSAMIVGVATHPEYRGQGLASYLMRRLCADLLAENRTVCLFYDNPVAGAIYKRLGFKDIGGWSMMHI